VAHSTDDEEVGMAQEVNHPKTSLNFPRRRWGSIGQVKLSPYKLSDQLEILSKKFAMDF